MGTTPVEPRKSCFSGFRPEFLSVPRAVLGQNGLKKTVFRNFPPLGARSAKTESAKKLCNFGENFWSARISPLRVPLAPGKWVFLFLARARNFYKCPRPKTGQKPTKSPFPTGGGLAGKKLFWRKLRKTIPRVAWYHFVSISGPLLLWGPERALRGCLLARRAGSTLVP